MRCFGGYEATYFQIDWLTDVAWMAMFYFIPQSCHVDVRINLRRSDALVAQHGLNGA